MRTISFFQARDQMNREFLAGSDMPPLTRAVFRYLIECTMFKGESYGWVNYSSCGVMTIAKITGLSERAVRTHLQMLEDHGLIKRYRRASKSGSGRSNDQLRIEWDYLYEGDEIQPAPDAGRERGAARNDVQPAPDAASSISKEKELQEPGEAGIAEVIEMPRRAHV